MCLSKNKQIVLEGGRVREWREAMNSFWKQRRKKGRGGGGAGTDRVGGGTEEGKIRGDTNHKHMGRLGLVTVERN